MRPASGKLRFHSGRCHGAAIGADAVAAARKDGQLDGFFVEQAAQADRREVVIAALAVLANVTGQTVKKSCLWATPSQ